MAKEEIVNKVKEVMNAPSCYSGLKKVCQTYLDAAGIADEEKAAAEEGTEGRCELHRPCDSFL